MDPLTHKIEAIFEQQNGMALAALLEPVSAGEPAGPSLSEDDLYQRIQQARLEDDNSTPRGVWEYDMQRADWSTVYDLSMQALQQSKDVQLAVWLMEAQLIRTGFGSIAPSMHLLLELLKKYWHEIHPQMPDADSEHRVNIISWINTKLTVAVKQIPITGRPDADAQYSWSDWEMALRNTQLITAHPEAAELKGEINVDAVVLHINQTAIEFYQQLYDDLELALQTIDLLVGFLDEKLGAESPSLGAISGLLEEIAGLAYHQLDQRGILPSSDAGVDADALLPQGQGLVGTIDGDPVQNRNEAYSALRSIADYLVVDDPHSPAPYLIYKAIEWGHMNTGQLYNELFIEHQGQLNIFEMLGVENTEQTTPTA